MSTTGPLTSPRACDEYMGARTGCYEWRAVRYRLAARWMLDRGLDERMTVTDVGAGMTEFDFCLRSEFGWRGRYIPVDGGIDGTDLEAWVPARTSEFLVALELVEHLHEWRRLVRRMQENATRGVALSTPNPATVDVLGMDPTHVNVVSAADLCELGFPVRPVTLYGGAFSGGRPDALFATWERG